MNNKERGNKIRRQILRDVQHHPRDLNKHIAGIFSITPQAVNSHVRRLEKEGWLASSGVGKGKRRFLGDLREYESLITLSDGLAEDQIWRNRFAFIFEGLSESVIDICHYGFTEMVNNAIDHSGGTDVYIEVRRSEKDITFYIKDNGEGIFKRIKRLCGLADERQAILELSKGKLTTDPENHTGEGIFFTSRVFDSFEIHSKDLWFRHEDQREYDWLDDSPMPLDKAGTIIFMQIKRDSPRLIEDIFNEFAAPDEFSFNKTVIPVRLAQYENEKLVSRSQAKRLLIRIERFENVIFDFTGVSNIGQAFADEIFRVYASRHPEIRLQPMKMEEKVLKMVRKAISALNEQKDN